MRMPIIALALLMPLPAVAGYVIHPAPGDPSPPAIVATSGDHLVSWTLDRYGQVWAVNPTGPWERLAEYDPPFSVSELLFWEVRSLVTSTGEVFENDPGVGWHSIGFPPSVAGAPDSRARTKSAIRSAPNPTAGPSRITFTLASAGHVSVRIFNATGRLVRTVLEGELPAGEVGVEWDGRSDQGAAVAAGIYFSRVETAQGSIAGRVVLAR